ncbi:MAG TPA: rhodanese-like domain-containing protein [Burkholderiaceae bacterium]|jgi:rhodanese-related sulfurtransferase|nr:rhodanese-like domain-containing protein [Burkholderiaceae bacterium]
MENFTPLQAREFLDANPDALFIDCRSEAEFYFVGHPEGAVHVSWAEAPDWEINPHFVAEIRKLVSHTIDRPVVVICRSGNRSVDAAKALEAAGFTRVINVLHGFEGSLNERHHRGEIAGWRFDGLPWEQL